MSQRHTRVLGAFILGTSVWATPACSSGDGGSGAGASAGEPASAGTLGNAPSGGRASAGGAGSGGEPDLNGPSGRSGAGSGGRSSASGGTQSGGAGRASTGNGGKASAGSGGRSSSGEGGQGAAGRAGSGGTLDPNTPTPSSRWVNVTKNLARMQSDCGNLTLVSAKPGSTTVIAGVAAVGLFASTADGADWQPLGTGSGSDPITHRPSSIVYDPENPDVFWESGIYEGSGLFKTTDGGVTLTALGDVEHNDLVSVDFSDPERKTLLLGGHEQAQTLYLSTNGGGSFRQIGGSLPGNTNFSSSPHILDAQTFLLGVCGWGDGTCGLYRSGNAGESWQRVSELAPFGAPLVTSSGAIYWGLDNGGLARGNADGTTWTQVANNAATPVELPDGRFLSVNGDRMAVSSNGEDWSPVGEELPYEPQGFTYSAARKTIFIWRGDCEDLVPSDAIMSAGFNYLARD